MKNVSLPYTTYIPWIVLSTSLKKKHLLPNQIPDTPKKRGVGNARIYPEKKPAQRSH